MLPKEAAEKENNKYKLYRLDPSSTYTDNMFSIVRALADAAAACSIRTDLHYRLHIMFEC